MSLDVDLLRSSFDLVVSREPQITALFCQILFAHHPRSRALVGRNARATQERMLQEALVAVVDHLDDATWLTQTLGALGDKLRDYGVTEEMYAWAGDSLIATLREVAGPEWTPELAAAWTEAYQAIATMMQQGARPRLDVRQLV